MVTGLQGEGSRRLVARYLRVGHISAHRGSAFELPEGQGGAEVLGLPTSFLWRPRGSR